MRTAGFIACDEDPLTQVAAILQVVEKGVLLLEQPGTEGALLCRPVGSHASCLPEVRPQLRTEVGERGEAEQGDGEEGEGEAAEARACGT